MGKLSDKELAFLVGIGFVFAAAMYVFFQNPSVGYAVVPSICVLAVVQWLIVRKSPNKSGK